MSRNKDAFGIQPSERLRLLLRAAEKGSLPDVANILQDDGNEDKNSYISQQEVSVDSCDDEGLTALHMSCANGHEAVVRFLLTRGASLDIVCRHGWTPLMFAAYYGHQSIVNLLSQSKAKINVTNLMGSTPLVCACRCGHSGIVLTLLEKGAKTNQSEEDFNPYATTPLLTAAQHGHIQVAQILIEWDADVNYQHPVTGWNALMIASLNGHLDVVKLLVEAGRADVNVVNAADQTALSVASLHCRRDVERYLDKRTSRKLENKVSKPSRPPIIEAAIEGKYDKVKEILQNFGKEVNAQDGDGATALIYASMKGHAEIVDLLIRKKADLDVQDKVTEWTALMQATCNGHVECINLLLKADADISIKDNKTRTVFDLATTVGNPEIIRQLVRKALEKGNALAPDSIKTFAVEDEDSENKGSVKSWISKMVSGKIQPWKTSRNSFPTSRVHPQPPDALGSTMISENSDPTMLVDTYSLRSSSSILSALDVNNKSPKEKPKIALLFPQTKLPDDVVAPVLLPFPRRTSFELPRMPKDAKLSSSGGADVSPQSSSSESSSFLKHSGYGRLTNRSQASQSMHFVADSPDSPLSSMTSTNSFFTSVSRQKGRPVMPSVSNGGIRRPMKAFQNDPPNTATQPLRNRYTKPPSSNTSSVASVNTYHSAPVQPSLVPRPPSKPRSRSSFPAITPRNDNHFSIRSSHDEYQENEVLRMLETLSLEKYGTKFEEEEIDMEAFLTMNDSDLQSLGIKQMTHRKQILDAIRELNAGKGKSREQTKVFAPPGKHEFKQHRGSITSSPGFMNLNAHQLTGRQKR
ncbi:ankyrin repeat and SAM domain-containing protein 6-like isoform X2 [Rhopilema esculentum]|uniref:ankyrin repeat and SAM domain-containing protein 6-like isoform X2 n=1 Tax=Rhopilema esculentum TaxID=499914 RepID=UPI0031DAD727